MQEPGIFDEPCRGTDAVNGGVIGMTEVSSLPLLALSLRQMLLKQKHASSMMDSLGTPQ